MPVLMQHGYRRPSTGFLGQQSPIPLAHQQCLGPDWTATTADLEGKLRQLWQELPQENVQRLYASMPNSIAGCLRATDGGRKSELILEKLPRRLRGAANETTRAPKSEKGRDWILRRSRDRGGRAVRTLTSHQDSISGRVTGFSHVGIVPDDAIGSASFSSWISRFPRPFIPALLHTRAPLHASALKSSLLRAAQISSLTQQSNANVHLLSSDECGALSLWGSFLDLVKLRSHEAEEHPESRTLAGFQKSWE
ncbi:hypothetical protein PR048_024808 [Dryococelus australis]|uniref:Uncharacterized protein n=1 Tax=Dryococelus australis TaxID=614101 RepID=A0ABQ9GPP5_9NEOP|nr:hypothetical protein PR048_024808 [Dryococelus australis]